MEDEWTLVQLGEVAELLTGFSGSDELVRTLEFSFSWAPSRPVAPNTAQRAAFSSDRIPVIREAGRQMREREPLPGFDLRSPVIRLERAEGVPVGKVTVMGLVDDRQVRVVMEPGDQALP